MNYNDQILENKPFNFFKQLMYNIAVAICILLVGVLVMVYGFGYKLYEVNSGSEEPYLPVGCMVVVEPRDEYKVGDLLTFNNGNMVVTHRLLAICEKNGNKIYLCHGDNVESVNPNSPTHIVPWEEDARYLQDLLDQNGGDYSKLSSNVIRDVQDVYHNEAIGAVVNRIDNVGSIITFIKAHYMLVIAIIAGVWCVSSVAQNEIEIKKAGRLL